MLNETVFRNDDVPAAERLAHWAERLRQTHAPVRVTSDQAHDFRASQRVLDLGAVTLWPATFEQLVIHRTPKMIRQSDPEQYHLSFIMGGTGGCTWDDHQTIYKPSDLHINDSSLPWEVHTGDPVTIVGIEVPKAQLPLPRVMAPSAIPRHIPTQDGIGALLAQFLTQLVTDTTKYQPADGPRLGTVLSDLVAALFAHTLETSNALPPDIHRRTLILRIKKFIRENLHDPRLTPTVVASTHAISTSYLHRLFQDEEETVAAWIRHQRLDAARRDLTDPALASTPIRTIAVRWGFPRAADFSRAFRNAYGLSPKDYRSQSR
ncbi:helix-turn-helix domain-containing protein [Streptomyces sp. NPDC048196]|uniref:AraC-like ligand-binding domain-containing protein n=1 Tax=Streptomyces sp. NPDC048196 TaxID=3154712 RepID=UPI0033FDBC18